MKPLCKYITSAFKLIFSEAISCYKRRSYFSGDNFFGTALNNTPVKDAVNKLNFVF